MGISSRPEIESCENFSIEHAAAIRNFLRTGGLYRSDSSDPTPSEQNDLWRISTKPYPLTLPEVHFLENLGQALLSFYETSNQLYLDSLNGDLPGWVAVYLNQGKPETVLEYARMNRFKRDLPRVIRPDLIVTEEGMVATELDAVPGGIGQTAALSAAFSNSLKENSYLVGGQEGMLSGFEKTIRGLSDVLEPFFVIVVSEESKSYRPEMQWLANALSERGLETQVTDPKKILFTEEGLWVDDRGKKRKIDILYRFFELFDLKNIPKSELIFYSAKKKRVVLTPPPKAQLEEKSLFALFHHPVLQAFWLRHLGQETYRLLSRVFPRTWILDPTPLPPHAVIPELNLTGKPVTDFLQLTQAKKKERQFAVKASGFSELAWGSRGVSIGHDLSEEDWKAALQNALDAFPETPYILQKFHKGKKIAIKYVEFEENRVVSMQGRVRLSPYYFVDGKKARLGGVLATICSLEKKLIHGMVDAVMAPCAIIGDNLKKEQILETV